MFSKFFRLVSQKIRLFLNVINQSRTLIGRYTSIKRLVADNAFSFPFIVGIVFIVSNTFQSFLIF